MCLIFFSDNKNSDTYLMRGRDWAPDAMYGEDCSDRKCSLLLEHDSRFFILAMFSTGLFAASSPNATSYLVSQVPVTSVCRKYFASVHSLKYTNIATIFTHFFVFKMST